mmetsp:Transcript_27178/g.82441  ORF Transcript_27178/g.82441 Transcript_27178/m.82441 type:complete len:91 (+) Transcript_27178:343-615(+)
MGSPDAAVRKGYATQAEERADCPRQDARGTRSGRAAQAAAEVELKMCRRGIASHTLHREKWPPAAQVAIFWLCLQHTVPGSACTLRPRLC